MNHFVYFLCCLWFPGETNKCLNVYLYSIWIHILYKHIKHTYLLGGIYVFFLFFCESLPHSRAKQLIIVCFVCWQCIQIHVWVTFYSISTLFVYYPYLMTSVTGALGNAHPWDTFQRPGRLTSGLARGGEKWGILLCDYMYI